MAALLGIDIGTTSTIAVLVRPDGTKLAERSFPVRLHSPHPGWSEEEPEQWWANARQACRELSAVARQEGEELLALGVSGMAPALVALDAAGTPIRRSIQQSDGRAAVEVEAMKASVSADFHSRSGCAVSQQLLAPKLRWLERQEPENFARIATVMGSYDYIAHLLTGERVVEENWALEAGFLDLATRQVAPDLVALGGIGASAVPPVRAASQIAGRISEEAARETGLPAGLPVIGGIADHVSAALMAGVTAPGQVLIKFGGAGDILAASTTPVLDSRLFLDIHPVPGLFMPNGCMATSGTALDWFAREFARDLGQGGHAAHAALDEAAAALPAADAPVMLPYLLGEKTPLNDPRARGVIFGLELGHTRAHLWRALLEAVAFGFRHHLDVFAELALPADRLIASDGGTRSAVWMQITADILQKPVEIVAGHAGSALGAAYVSGVAVGAIPGWGETHRFVRSGGTVRPNPSAAAAHDRAYRTYRELYDRLAPVFTPQTPTTTAP
ncbi:FGGY-family carbohydrate kinase [Roseococcus pinisoli]|uniref:Carbohydrate kinase n=1 Tax=Roseococcus pinisoli TaxID=2835040 RepID=A0ABS5QDU0_9PROT|nr:FGGY family carbohydrate kinase [Roseococcus pinisoli]MBS7811875.1 carbohydrate kinase [Roseococcus pinisoli]